MNSAALQHRQDQPTSGAWFFLIFGFFFGGIPGMIGLGLIFAGEIFPALFTLIFVSIGGLMFAFGVSVYLGERLIQKISLSTPRARLHLGERFRVRFAGTAKSRFKLTSATFKFKLTEQSVRRRGTKSTHFTEERFVQTVVLDEPLEFTPGSPVEFEAAILIDPAGPATFEGKRNSLKWTVSVDLDVPDWPDPSYSWPIEVEPVLRFDEEDEAGFG